VINDIKNEATARMSKSIEALEHAFARLRTGRANPSLLDGIVVAYYGNDTPLKQVAAISIEDARTLVVTPWERKMVPDIEKAILKSDLGITPATSSDKVRIPLPPLTEQNRKELVKQAKHEAEQARVAVRNIRRDALADVRELAKEKLLSEDEARRAEEEVQKLTDKRIAEVDHALARKEADLLEI
jgi:ribosome recycling factor